MSLNEASAALGETLRAPGEECGYVTPSRAPRGMQFMVVRGRVARVDIGQESDVRTLSGAGVGDSEERVRSLYPGRIRTEPHPYTGPQGHELIFVPADSRDTAFALVFETDGERVVNYRAGIRPMVLWVEGCS
jgi:hypothetical protein